MSAVLKFPSHVEPQKRDLQDETAKAWSQVGFAQCQQRVIALLREVGQDDLILRVLCLESKERA